MGRYQDDRLANLIIEDAVGNISRESHLQMVFESIFCVLNGITAEKPVFDLNDS